MNSFLGEQSIDGPLSLVFGYGIEPLTQHRAIETDSTLGVREGDLSRRPRHGFVWLGLDHFVRQPNRLVSF